MIDEITRHLNGNSDKVDLKAEKIELADVQSFIKKVAVASKLEDSVGSSRQQAKTGINSYLVASKQTMNAYQDVIAEYNTIVDMAKALGLELPKNLKDDFVTAKQYEAIAKKNFQNAEKALGQL